MTKTAARHGVALKGRARQVRELDLLDADYVIAMDGDNHADIRALMADAGPPVYLLRAWDADAAGETDVPDPYYGGAGGFERVYAMVERSCRALLHQIREERGL